MNNNSVRFVYLRDSKRQPISCIAVVFDKETKQVAYNISVLNPHDRFDRDVARDLAVGRLIRKTIKINLYSPGVEITCHYITQRILEDLLMWNEGELPYRAKRAAKKWLDTNRREPENSSPQISTWA